MPTCRRCRIMWIRDSSEVRYPRAREQPMLSRVQSLIDYIAISGTMERNVLEFVDHLHEHFVTSCSINSRGRYNVPTNPEEGYRHVAVLYPTLFRPTVWHFSYLVSKCTNPVSQSMNGRMERTGKVVPEISAWVPENACSAVYSHFLSSLWCIAGGRNFEHVPITTKSWNTFLKVY